jgi:hypothetical protein
MSRAAPVGTHLNRVKTALREAFATSVRAGLAKQPHQDQMQPSQAVCAIVMSTPRAPPVHAPGVAVTSRVKDCHRYGGMAAT